MPPPQDAPPSLLVRVPLALVALAIAAFFGVLCAMIVSAPIDDVPPFTALSLRGFGLFMFGGIAGGALAFAFRQLFPAREPPLPPALLARCPACGEPWTASDTCAHCPQPRAASMAAWTPGPRPPDNHPFFFGSMGAAMFCLGLFLGSSSTKGGLFPLIAYNVLALLLVVVGGAIVWGAALLLRDQWRARGKRDFSLYLRTDAGHVDAQAHLERSELSMQGSTLRWLSLDLVEAAEAAPAPREPALRALIKILAVLHAREELDLTYAETTTWRFDGALRRERAVDVNAGLFGLDELERTGEEDGDWSEEAIQSFPALADPVLASLVSTSARKLAQRLADWTELRAAYEQRATELPAEEVDEHTKAVLTAVLREGQTAAGVPYREQG